MLGSHRVKHLVSNVSHKKFNYHFQSAAFQHYHPRRQSICGNDRFLISPNLIALVDGGTANLDETLIDYHDYPSRLIELIHKFHSHERRELFKNPSQLIKQSLEFNKNSGSSTVTLLMLDESNGDFKTFYIGNSVYAIFRKKDVECVQPQEHDFNVPFAIGKQGVNPALGFTEQYHHPYINDQDIIVIGTNGLWDNLGIEYMHYQLRGPRSYRPLPKARQSTNTSLSEEPRQRKSLAEMVKQVGEMAKIGSVKGNYESPFYLRAKKQGKEVKKEGVLDDITVILAQISKHEVISTNS